MRLMDGFCVWGGRKGSTTQSRCNQRAKSTCGSMHAQKAQTSSPVLKAATDLVAAPQRLLLVHLQALRLGGGGRAGHGTQVAGQHCPPWDASCLLR